MLSERAAGAASFDPLSMLHSPRALSVRAAPVRKRYPQCFQATLNLTKNASKTRAQKQTRQFVIPDFPHHPKVTASLRSRLCQTPPLGPLPQLGQNAMRQNLRAPSPLYPRRVFAMRDKLRQSAKTSPLAVPECCLSRKSASTKKAPEARGRLRG